MKNTIYKNQDEAGEYITEEITNGNPEKLIVYAHGFGVKRGDASDMFYDVASIAKNSKSLLIDLNQDEESGFTVNDLISQSIRLNSEISKFKASNPGLPIILVGHSMGCALIAKDRILAEQAIFLAPAVSNVEAKLKPRLMEREGSYHSAEEGILYAKRSDGTTSRVPDSFFDVLKGEIWKNTYHSYIRFQPNIFLVVAGEDEILKAETKGILELKFKQIDIVEGADHNFLGESRKKMLSVVSNLLN